MSVKEYSLKFVNLLKYASSPGENSRDKMSMFVIGVSEDLVEDGRESMLHDNMDLGRLMVYAQHVEESRQKRRIHEGKKSKATNQTSSSSGRGSFAVQNRPKFMRHSGNSAPSGNFNAKFNNFDPKKGNDRGS